MKQQQSSSAVIRHEGRVLSVTSVQTKVEILAQTACAACHAKAVCGASNGESRVITIRREDDGGFVALYYLVLAQFRDRLNSGFVFTVEKINN